MTGMSRASSRQLALAVIASLLVIGTLSAVLWPKGPPRLQLSQSLHDFGTIKSTDKVETIVSVRNTGGQPLEILSVTTSCGCTKAQLASAKLAPGEETTLHIVFDAASHSTEQTTSSSEPEAVSHVAYLRTTDPAQPEAEIEIRARVVNESKALTPPGGTPLPSVTTGEGPGRSVLVRPLSEKDAASKRFGVRATIYYNEACHDCVVYLDHELIPLLKELGGMDIVKKDYISERKNRSELLERSTRLQIPAQLQGHLTVFLDDTIILQVRSTQAKSAPETSACPVIIWA